jgi:hypothetical protein
MIHEQGRLVVSSVCVEMLAILCESFFFLTGKNAIQFQNAPIIRPNVIYLYLMEVCRTGMADDWRWVSGSR